MIRIQRGGRGPGAQAVVTVKLRQLVRYGRYVSGVGILVVGLLLIAKRYQTGTPVDWPEGTAGFSSGAAPLNGRRLSDEDAGGCGAAHMGVEHSLTGTLAFLTFCFVLCNFLDHMNLLVPLEWRFPLSVILFIAGKIMGATMVYWISDRHAFEGSAFGQLIDGVRGAARFNPHALLMIILPPLLYESASSMQWHTLRKVLPSSVILAVPGVCLNTVLTGIFVRLVFSVNDESPGWAASFLLACILSATDPVAVVAALSALGAPAKLSTLIEGESLLNDGSAVVLMYVMRDLTMSSAGNDEKDCIGFDFGCIIGNFCKVALGGCAIGLIAGWCLYWWLSWARTRHDTKLELSIVLSVLYATFFIAEEVHTSGVLAVVTLGIIVCANAKARMSHDCRHAHHVVMEQISYACNQVIFFAAGIISTRFMWGDHKCSYDYKDLQAWWHLSLLYIVIHLTRLAVVVVFLPLLKRLGYGINWKEGTILVFGGLRGAVGLVMGLIIEHNQYIDKETKQMIAFQVSGIVLLTLFINGSTIDGLYKRLNIYPVNGFRMTHLGKVLYKIEADCQRAGFKQMETDWFFHDTIFGKIIRCVPNFRHIQFNNCGQPYPDLVLSVPQALEALADDEPLQHSTSFNAPIETGRIHSFRDRFEDRWERRKLDAETRFKNFIEDSVQGEILDKRDQIVNLMNTGNADIEFRPQDGSCEGFYISSRSLGRILKDQSDEMTDVAGFRVRVVKTVGIRILVGFVTNADALNVGKMRARCEDAPLLGTIENTIALDCLDGSVLRNGPSGLTADQASSSPIAVGDTVALTVHRTPGHEWEVRVCIICNGRKKCESSYEIGPFPPEEVFPAVEFRCDQDLKRNKSTTSGVIAGAASQIGTALLTGGWSAKAAGKRMGTESLTLQRNTARRPPTLQTGPDIPGVAPDLDEGRVGAKVVNDLQAEDVSNTDENAPSPSRRTELPGSPGLLAARERSVEFVQASEVLSTDPSAPISKGPSAASSAETEEPIMPRELPRVGLMEQSPKASYMEAMSAQGSTALSSAFGRRSVNSSSHAPRMSTGSDHRNDDEIRLQPLVKAVGSTTSSAWVAGTSSVRTSPSPLAVTGAKVMLNFEPQLASDSESINELFHVLFNTVMHHYKEMHEHGILCDQALSWLTESVAEAMDCANQEVNSMRAADYLSPRAFQSSPSKLLFRTATSFFQANTSDSATIQHVRDVFKDNSRQGILSLFEPLIVEYLSLEAMIARPTTVEKVVQAMDSVNILSFNDTRSKVDALWAFVEAHVIFIKESPAMERFPDLLKCLWKVVEEARNDLNILADIQPRAFFYSKHGLALRIILHKRLKKLIKVTDAGWITPEDGEVLKASLLERIQQADEFFPRKHCFSNCYEAAHTRFSLQEDEATELNAWDDPMF